VESGHFLGGVLGTFGIVYFSVNNGRAGRKGTQRGLSCLEVSRGTTYLWERRFQAFVVDLKSFFEFASKLFVGSCLRRAIARVVWIEVFLGIVTAMNPDGQVGQVGLRGFSGFFLVHNPLLRFATIRAPLFAKAHFRDSSTYDGLAPILRHLSLLFDPRLAVTTHIDIHSLYPTTSATRYGRNQLYSFRKANSRLPSEGPSYMQTQRLHPGFATWFLRVFSASPPASQLSLRWPP
jgi:hypothetical protein